MSEVDIIPIIDLACLSSTPSLTEFNTLAQELKKNYSELGFAYVSNHGIRQADIDAVFEQTKRFHALAEQEKTLVKQGSSLMGYIPLESSTLKISSLGSATRANQTSGYVIYNESSNEHYRAVLQSYLGPNQWPSEHLLPGFKTILLTYAEQLSQLMRRLIQVFSFALHGNEQTFDHYFINPTVFLRLQYYPPQPKTIPCDQYGLAPHTDYGGLTLLAQEKIGGLQIRMPNGTWVDVPPKPDMFILNIGDMMRLISNECLIATPHRVMNLSGVKRYSVPLFFDPDLRAKIPVRSPNAQIGDIVYGEHLFERVKNNYTLEV